MYMLNPIEEPLPHLIVPHYFKPLENYPMINQSSTNLSQRQSNK